MQLDADFILNVLVDVDIESGSFPKDTAFSVNTRTLQQGDIFVALLGERVDGHSFIGEALLKGASGFILAKSKRTEILQQYGKDLKDKYLLFVEDPLSALCDLAKKWRKNFSYPVVAITGSVGKTTTKEMVRNIVKQTNDNYFVSVGNQNTMIGVSLNILKMKPDHKAAIFEVGISQRGDMEKLSDLLQPTIAAIIKVGHGHMEGLGDISTIAREKRAVFSSFAPENIGIINGDQADLSSVSYPHPVVRFGSKTTNQIQARKIKIENNSISFIAKIYNEKHLVMLPGSHEGRVIDALAAISVGYLLEIPTETLVKGVQQEVAVNGRFEIQKHETGSYIINDGYNSNPDSAKAALLALEAYSTDKKKVVVLADMLELGLDSIFWHRQLGRVLRKLSDLQHVVLIGKDIQAVKKTMPLGLPTTLFDSWQESQQFLQELLKDDIIMLVKGSNGMGLCSLVTTLLQKK